VVLEERIDRGLVRYVPCRQLEQGGKRPFAEIVEHQRLLHIAERSPGVLQSVLHSRQLSPETLDLLRWDRLCSWRSGRCDFCALCSAGLRAWLRRGELTASGREEVATLA